MKQDSSPWRATVSFSQKAIEELKIDGVESNDGDDMSLDILFDKKEDITVDTFLSKIVLQMSSLHPNATIEKRTFNNLTLRGGKDSSLLEDELLEFGVLANKIVVVKNTSDIMGCFDSIIEDRDLLDTSAVNSKKNNKHCYFKFYSEWDDNKQIGDEIKNGDHHEDNTIVEQEIRPNSPYILFEHTNTTTGRLYTFAWRPTPAETAAQAQENNTIDSDSKNQDNEQSSGDHESILQVDWNAEFASLSNQIYSVFSFDQRETFSIQIKNVNNIKCQVDIKDIVDGNDLEHIWTKIMDTAAAGGQMNENTNVIEAGGRLVRQFVQCGVILDHELIEMSAGSSDGGDGDDDDDEHDEKLDMLRSTKGNSDTKPIAAMNVGVITQFYTFL